MQYRDWFGTPCPVIDRAGPAGVGGAKCATISGPLGPPDNTTTLHLPQKNTGGKEAKTAERDQ